MNSPLIITALSTVCLGAVTTVGTTFHRPRFGIRRALGVLGAAVFSIGLAGGVMAQPAVASSGPQLIAVHEVAGCGPDSYVNSDGRCVHDPQSSATAPDGATAQCSDGTYSFSQHRSGTCSRHGGVSRWL
ncbi:DUF3761 domain-containing protein [Nocardia sp. NPDC052254]|uniref:DUF3761 domain-containing protein n=1 Tax=Nocardia sp. NPDC052254 TaxID=3155681 RepID=UPI0034179CCB